MCYYNKLPDFTRIFQLLPYCRQPRSSNLKSGKLFKSLTVGKELGPKCLIYCILYIYYTYMNIIHIWILYIYEWKGCSLAKGHMTIWVMPSTFNLLGYCPVPTCNGTWCYDFICFIYKLWCKIIIFTAGIALLGFICYNLTNCFYTYLKSFY